ncbi:MAG: anti-sigma F factor [Clostridia bacterium]|nr:anti-sigma F factor [Clostridia bacterium]
MAFKNEMNLKFSSLSINESFARNVIGCFALQLNPSVAEMSDIKTAVSEAVTNCIVHGYDGKIGQIEISAWIVGQILHIKIFDRGVGIENISEALEPFYTTKPDQERSGMGFTIMKSFMDKVEVVSKKGEGTTIYMTKKIRPTSNNECV